MPDRRNIKTSLSDAVTRMSSSFTLFVWLLCVILGAVAGPFGTLHVMDLPVRLGFWFIIVSLALVLGYGARAAAMIMVPAERVMLRDSIAILTMTAVFSPVVWGIGRGFDAAFGGAVPPFPVVAFYVFSMSIAVFMARRLTPGIEGAPPTEAQEAVADDLRPEPRLLRRLPVEQQTDILRLTANGHYIEVVTITGEETLRMRLADAIHEMEPVPGLSTHRSHWVALHAISHAELRNAHKAFLVLINGDKVPVSRGYRRDLEERGLL